MKYLYILAIASWLVCSTSSCHQVAYRKNELNAVDIMKAIKSAQHTYKSTQGAGKYGTLKELAEAKLIKPELSNGKYSGYLYNIRVTENSFTAVAIPERYGENFESRSGGVSLFLDETGVIRFGYKNGKEATINDPPLPNQ